MHKCRVFDTRYCQIVIPSTIQGEIIAGVDEAGRGPLAGPVVAAAVIYTRTSPPDAVKDSKCLSDKKRRQLASLIMNTADAWAVASASVAEIDQLNIHHATLLAMQRAIEQLTLLPDQCWIDGKFVPSIAMRGVAIVNGDALVPVISAASILAKVQRDDIMLALAKDFPNYRFCKHKGYGTALHLAALQQFGATEHHRRTFKPVRDALSRC